MLVGTLLQTPHESVVGRIIVRCRVCFFSRPDNTR